MNIVHTLITVIVGALLFKGAVYLISPDSPNSVIRAIVTSVVATIAVLAVAMLSSQFLGAGMALLAMLFAPLMVIRASYGMSLFRAFIVTVVFGAFIYLAQHIEHQVLEPKAAAPVTSQV